MQECTEKTNISKILDRVGELEQSRARTDVLIETFSETNRELSSTMKKVGDTMIQMQSSLEKNKDSIGDLTKKVDKLTENDEKNKIDIRDILKSQMTKVIVGGAGLYGIYELVQSVISK
jgi:CII-binding regulator of phage lambda lysogenization HflD